MPLSDANWDSFGMLSGFFGGVGGGDDDDDDDEE